MNRLQFWIAISLSGLVVLFLLLQVIFALQAQRGQLRLAWAEQQVNQGRVCQQRWQQLAARIYQVGQQTQDQALKDLLTHNGITIRVKPSANAPATSPTPAPTAPPPLTR